LDNRQDHERSISKLVWQNRRGFLMKRYDDETLTLEGWNRFWTWLGKKIGLLI
jgi:hypothetical protein